MNTQNYVHWATQMQYLLGCERDTVNLGESPKTNHSNVACLIKTDDIHRVNIICTTVDQFEYYYTGFALNLCEGG